LWGAKTCRVRKHRIFVHLSATELGRNSATMHDENRVAQMENFRKFGRDQKNRNTLIGKFEQELMDPAFAPTRRHGLFAMIRRRDRSQATWPAAPLLSATAQSNYFLLDASSANSNRSMDSHLRLASCSSIKPND